MDEKCPPTESLAALDDVELTAEARAELVRHLVGCASCSAAVAALRPSSPAGSVAPTDGSDDEVRPSSGLPARVGRYVIERRIGAGGMGIVYRARDPELGRTVAVKVLRPGVAGERLKREAQALARLEHPNVVTVHDLGTDGETFIAMAYVDGDNLRQWLRARRSRDQTLGVLLAAGRGVAAAHAVGLVHRDLKPDNIFVSHKGQVLVGDFGLVRDLESADGIRRGDVGDDAEAGASNDLTRGRLLGTPAYMAPEQAAGAAIEASDQFSFCVTAWEALTGARPFAGETLSAIVDAARRCEIAATPKANALPARIDRTLRRGLRADPSARFGSMDDLLRALAPPSATRRRALAGTVVVGGAAVAVAILAMRPPPAQGPGRLPCGGEAAQQAAVWNPAHRAAVAASFARQPDYGTHGPRILALLDRRSAVLVREQAVACAAQSTGGRERYEHQVACFDEHRARLGHVVDAIATGVTLAPPLDLAVLVERAVPAERCQLAWTAPPRATLTAAQRSGIDRIRAELVRDRVVARSNVESTTVLAGLRSEAEKLGHPPLVAEVALAQAALAEQRADYPAAEEAGNRARALAHGELARAEAEVLLAQVVARGGNYEVASDLLTATNATWERIGRDGWLELRILEARAVLSRVRNTPDAVAAAEALVARTRAFLGEESPALAHALGELSVAYPVGERDRSSRTAAEMNQIWPPDSASFEDRILRASTRVEQAATPAATIAAQRELVALLASLPPSEMEAFATATLGDFLFMSTRWDEAALVIQRALDVYSAAAIDDPALRFVLFFRLGQVELERGATAAAIAALETARGLMTPRVPREDERVDFGVVLGRAYVGAGRHQHGIDTLTPLVKQLRLADPPRWMNMATACAALADALFETGGEADRDRARALAQDAARAFKASIEKLSAQPGLEALVALQRRRAADLATWIATHGP